MTAESFGTRTMVGVGRLGQAESSGTCAIGRTGGHHVAASRDLDSAMPARPPDQQGVSSRSCQSVYSLALTTEMPVWQCWRNSDIGKRVC